MGSVITLAKWHHPDDGPAPGGEYAQPAPLFSHSVHSLPVEPGHVMPLGWSVWLAAGVSLALWAGIAKAAYLLWQFALSMGV